ncbi:imelysin family protein [Magnetospirillum sulfuroxidans]|uniref:Imelysin family protein n=1 Tax=Magnetospirillum sulfuroxidans TaxID=611300 RepID=A0ABS5I8T0_9PROT|nr:imelysin family protein [Magnetospirillum sulfuroxidans]MBR9970098.1 imelysin family protein [Magnetospirillum sulfuroxidans]
MRFWSLLGLGLLAASPAQAALDYAGLLTLAADGPIIASYQDFQSQTDALKQSVESFCAAPDAGGLEAARTAFHATTDSWQQVQWIGYGPVEAFHRGQRVQFWPDKKNAGDRQMLALLKDRKADAVDPNRVVFASVAIQGLPALEMLLFGDGQADKVLAGGDETALRCRLISGIAHNLNRIGGELVHEWAKPDGFTALLKNAGTGANPYADHRQAASQMFNALHGQLSAITEVKLAHPLGAAAAEARPGRSENWRSKRSARNIDINLESMRAVFAASFAPILAANGKSAAADRFLAALTEAQATLRKLPAPMEVAMTDPEGWKQLAGVKAKIKAAALILETDIANALDLQVGFNALDGD